MRLKREWLISIVELLESKMPNFYVNKNTQANGDNEVHRTDGQNCPTPAETWNRVDLGLHSDCHGAVNAAKRMGYNANGCYYCANACHTS